MPQWSRSFAHPAMTLRVGAEPSEVLDALARGLATADYKSKDATAEGFRAVHFPWRWLLVGETAYRTELLVRSEGSEVTIAVGRNSLSSPPRRKAAQGINAAVAELRSRGRGVHWTPWTERPR